MKLLVNSAGAIEGYGVADAGSAVRADRDIEINFLGSLRMCEPWLAI